MYVMTAKSKSSVTICILTLTTNQLTFLVRRSMQ